MEKLTFCELQQEQYKIAQDGPRGIRPKRILARAELLSYKLTVQARSVIYGRSVPVLLASIVTNLHLRLQMHRLYKNQERTPSNRAAILQNYYSYTFYSITVHGKDCSFVDLVMAASAFSISSILYSLHEIAACSWLDCYTNF